MIIPHADNDGNRGECAKLESVNAFVTIIEGLEVNLKANIHSRIIER